ncbi:hypothetical protein JK358_38150 [Nocardia sp. 2]|uniref:Uncharacterized protein n=1 Tax=Nocardia acididurans TaxID=2802282 RepID=A0ABS1MI23_9NOCA|nr:hypothetical protein [Nocardia acididurans]MBL1080234.1 hypothetical protein [Nocardia acididurans]
MAYEAIELLNQILDRYGSLDVFIAQLYRELDDAPTQELPRLTFPAPTADGGGRHALRC